MLVPICGPCKVRSPCAVLRTGNDAGSELAQYAPYVSMETALKADVVMMLRVQLERHNEGVFKSSAEYREQYGLTEERAAKLSGHTMIMHPAPVNRNVEIDDAVVESPRSMIFKQMANGCRYAWRSWNGRWSDSNMRNTVYRMNKY